MNVVVDTDVVSYTFKGDTRAHLYNAHLAGRTLSPMTLAELEQWMLERNWGETRKESLRAHLRRYTVVPFDEELCEYWARARVSAKRNGRRIPTADAWIAAVALWLDAPLVTHNADDFAGVDDLTVISES